MTEQFMRVKINNVIKTVEREWIWSKWGSTLYNISGVPHTTRVFDMACADVCECGRNFSSNFLKTENSKTKKGLSKPQKVQVEFC